MLTIDNLNKIGVNTSEGLARCLNNEAFYLRLVGRVRNDATFDKLYEAIENKDLKQAFEYAHSLKGVLGNLSLTPMEKPIKEITEYLRHEEQIDYVPYIEEIKKQKAIFDITCDE